MEGAAMMAAQQLLSDGTSYDTEGLHCDDNACAPCTAIFMRSHAMTVLLLRHRR